MGIFLKKIIYFVDSDTNVMDSSRKRSDLWLHFTQQKNEKARCDLCKNIFSYKNGTTSNLRKHLANKHNIHPPKESKNCNQNSNDENKDEFENHEKKCQNNIVQYMRTVSVSRKKQIDNLILKMIVKDFQPFSIVEDEGFVALLKFIEPHYEVPHRTHFSRDLLLPLYNESVQKLIVILKDAHYITLTTDTWTSAATESFIAVTAHFINKNWEMVSYLLDCSVINESHTAENLRESVIQIVKKYNIQSKVRAIVTDNAKNMLSAFQMEKTNWYHWPCTAHTINLIVQNGIKAVTDIQEKTKNIVRHFHMSTTAKNKLKEIQLQMKPHSEPVILINDVCTRWNSTFLMFNRFIKIQEPLEATLAILHYPVLGLSEDDWKTLKELCKILVIFENLTKELSAQKFITISKVLVMIQGIKKNLQSLRVELKERKSINVLEIILNELNTRKSFQNMEQNPILSRATFLDPRFKTKAFDNDKALEKVKENIITNIRSETNSNSSDSSIDLYSENDANTEINHPIWGSFVQKVRNSTNFITPSVSTMLQIRQYIEEPYLGLKEDPLLWWKSRSNTYKFLTDSAKKHLGVLATSVPSERVFSAAGQVISDRRTRLSAENAKMVIFLNANKKFL